MIKAPARGEARQYTAELANQMQASQDSGGFTMSSLPLPSSLSFLGEVTSFRTLLTRVRAIARCGPALTGSDVEWNASH